MNKTILLASIFLANTALATNTNNLVKINVERLHQTCSCINCDLHGADLKNFQPGSSNEKNNIFAKNLNGQPWLICILSSANLQGADLSNSNFTITMRGYLTPLVKSNFKNTDFSNANLSNSIFYGAKFLNANFTNAKLDNSDLSLANLQGANLTNASLINVKAQMDTMHGWGANFESANFTKANLSNANLAGDFKSANFTNANLSNATLKNVTTDGQDGSWSGTNFENVNLKNTTLLDINGKPSALEGALFCNTIMPDGAVNNSDCKAGAK